MGLNEKTVEKRYIYRGKIVNLRCDDAVLPNGRACKREVIEHPGGACVLCEYGGKIAFVRQFRYAYGEELLELPAGKLNAGEDPAVAAGRELGEETGLVAERLKPLYTIYPTPGYTDEKIYLYEAVGVSEGKQHLDEGEFLNVEYYTVQEALQKIASGEIKDAKTLIAVLHYARQNGI